MKALQKRLNLHNFTEHSAHLEGLFLVNRGGGFFCLLPFLKEHLKGVILDFLFFLNKKINHDNVAHIVMTK